MKLALGYPFYIFDEQQTPLELDPAYGEEFTQKYNLKMAKLAFDVAELIKKMDAQSAVGRLHSANSPQAKPTVYWPTAPSRDVRTGRRLFPICAFMGIRYWQRSNCLLKRRLSSASWPR